MTTQDEGFSLTEFEIELGEAGMALQALAEGPGRLAADALREGFAGAAGEIERALLSAAETGELSFDTLFRRILDDLARIAAEWAITAAGIGTPAGEGGAPLNINFNLSGGAETGVLQNQGRMAQMLAGALRAGGRYS